MPSTSTLPNTNRRTLKRSFTAITVTGPSPERIVAAKTSQLSTRRSIKATNHSTIRISRRGSAFVPLGMATASGPNMYEKHVPFLSVYSIESSAPNLGCWSPPTSNLPEISGPTYTESLPSRSMAKISRIENTRTDVNSAFQLKFKTKSNTQPPCDSPASSPTTTICTIDSSSSDPSTISSLKSPLEENNATLSANTLRESEKISPDRMIEFSLPRLSSTAERPMTSPGVKKRNPKSLALKLSPSIDTFHMAEPSSLCFIKPPTLRGKKKPSLLSLNTGAANNTTIEPPAHSGVPTMLQRRSLKHSVSSPLMLSTPKLGPAGGMSLRTHTYSRLRDRETSPENYNGDDLIQEESHESSTGIQMATRLPGVTVGGDAFDRAHSGEDSKTSGYPNGPILMYEPNIYLYSEPSLEEAMEFDVIINVAREVRCPFKVTEHDSKPQLRRSNSYSAIGSAILSPTCLGEVPSISSVMKLPTEVTSSVSSSPSKTFPEYIHISWDHSTDVKDELWDLCQLIEDRANKGKKVLIHCQQGASRSATLIIAYGMFKNQHMGPNEVYQLAQSRSQWVNPNMSLLFSLNDFKKVIDEKIKVRGGKGERILEPKTSTLTPMVENASNVLQNGFLSGVDTTQTAGRESFRDSVPGVESTISEASVHEMNKTILRLGTIEFGLSPRSSSREWKNLVIPYVEAINISLERLPRVFSSDPESSGKFSILPQRVIDFTWTSIFPYQSIYKKNEPALAKSDDETI